MFKAEQFNNLLNEVHKKEEEEKRKAIRKDKEIRLQIRLIEDSLNDMENKFKQALEKGTEYPKFALVKFPICDEVKKELIMNQGYLLDESFGQTKIFYNKELFNEYRNNTKQESKVENKVDEELTTSNLKAQKHNISKDDSEGQFKSDISDILNILFNNSKGRCR